MKRQDIVEKLRDAITHPDDWDILGLLDDAADAIEAMRALVNDLRIEFEGIGQ